MNDLYDEGMGAALSGRDWPATVMGRFLKPWERRALAAGWRAGLRDLEAYRADMACGADLVAAGSQETLPW